SIPAEEQGQPARELVEAHCVITATQQAEDPHDVTEDPRLPEEAPDVVPDLCVWSDTKEVGETTQTCGTCVSQDDGAPPHLGCVAESSVWSERCCSRFGTNVCHYIDAAIGGSGGPAQYEANMAGSFLVHLFDEEVSTGVTASGNARFSIGRCVAEWCPLYLAD